MENCLSKIDMSKVYNSVVKYAPKEFGISIEKYMNKYDIPMAWRNPYYHLRKNSDGPIMINGENYIASKVFFGTLFLAVKTRIREEALKYLKAIHECKQYKNLSKELSKHFDIEFISKFTLELHNYNSMMHFKSKMKNKVNQDMPERPNYESKSDYIKNCINSDILMLYIDDYKALLNYNDKIL